MTAHQDTVKWFSRDNRCIHLRQGLIPLHLVMRAHTIPDNGTDFDCDLELELCVFCTGMVQALAKRMVSGQDLPHPDIQAAIAAAAAEDSE
jgi:hypothetical protein